MRERGLVALADDEQMVPALALEDGFGRAFDRVRRAEPAARGGGRRGRLACASARRADRSRGCRRAHCPRRRSGSDGGRRARSASARTLSSQASRSSSGSQTTWNGLLPFERAGGVVVDAFAGTREQARRGVVVVHDEVGVGLVALERDADDHLAERGAGERVGAAERLRAEQHMDAERAALAHDAVEQQRRGLRDACRPRRRTPGTRR